MLISLDNLSFGYKDEILLSDVNLTVNEGEHVGLIGGNGEGKTTLLRLIDRSLSPTSGKVFLKSNIRIGYLEQIGGFDSKKTVWEEMLSVFTLERDSIASLRNIEQKIATVRETDAEFAVLSAKYEYLTKLIAANDGYNYEIKIKTVLNGMGFEKFYDQPISTMSGGEKTKLKFCKLLLEEPDVLILDEPTNHLDVKTLFWLEEYLTSYKGAILIVSHDRYFLDKLVTKVFELENKTVAEFKGNYSKYKILKAEKVAAQWKQYEKQQAEIAHMQEYVDKNLVRASTTKMAQSRRTALEKMDRIERPFSPPTPPKFHFTYAEKPYEQVLEIKDFNLSAGDKPLFSGANATVRRGEKCALVGDNGTGKSTLLKQIVFGKKQEISLSRTVKIAFYDQENANLKANNTVLQELWERHVLSSQTEIRANLARAGLCAEDIDKPVSALSGGERAKLALSVFESEHGNFLILDEPTNHLDLAARESLEKALQEFDGTVLFVSHDRYFIKALADKILEIENNNFTEFKGSYEEYLTNKKESSLTTTAPPLSAQQKFKTNENFKSKQDRAQEAKRRQRIRELEKQISALEEEETQISAQLTDPAVTADYTLLSEKCARLEQIKTLSDKLYEEYETLI